MDFHSQKVIDAFFQTFYHQRIEIVREVGSGYNRQLDISLLDFWFSVIDFYGGIYYIGKHDKKETYKNGVQKRLKLACKQSFSEFILDFFPAPNNELGEFIYSIFRSGLVHQLSPKKGEILWDNTNSKLLWVKIDNTNPDNTANKVATINIYVLARLAYEAYKEYRKRIENDNLILHCKNIFNHLLKTPDGLEDGITLDTEYSKLTGAIKKAVTI